MELTKSHRKFNIFGLKINIRRKGFFYNELRFMIKQNQRKMSLENNICRVKNTKFYVPNYPIDYIQSVLVDENEFYEIDSLNYLKKYLPKKDAVIFDIGANIGNHSLFWAQYCNAEKIYSFEPVDTTYNILCKNIELNNLQDKITPNMFALSDENCFGEIDEYTPENVGGTVVKHSDNFSTIKFIKLDDYKFSEDKIDLIKIDVEGHEAKAIKGMKNTIQKYKPVIFVEIFPDNFETSNKVLNDCGYKMIEKVDEGNYIFRYAN